VGGAGGPEARRAVRPSTVRTSVRVAIRRPESRQRARALREQGWALRRIANEVGAALSTVSLWVRDIQPAVADAGAALPRPDRSGSARSALELRRCGRCLRDLPLTSFNRHRNGLQWWCRDCFRAYFRSRGQLHRRQVHLARRVRRREARAFVHDHLRTRCCSDCGELDPWVLEFHHFREKRKNVADMVLAGYSVHALERELGSCTVVCVNCHRLRTATAQGSWRINPRDLDGDSRLTSGERRNMIYLRELLMRSRCVDCGDSRLVVLDFDHVGAKAANVTEIARRGCSLSRLEAEVAQCEVRCANCHRRRTLGSASGDEEDERAEDEECPRQDSNLQPSP
jgi:hypothetical protein